MPVRVLRRDLRGAVLHAVHDHDDLERVPARLERRQVALQRPSEPVLLIPRGNDDAHPWDGRVRGRHCMYSRFSPYIHLRWIRDTFQAGSITRAIAQRPPARAPPCLPRPEPIRGPPGRRRQALGTRPRASEAARRKRSVGPPLTSLAGGTSPYTRAAFFTRNQRGPRAPSPRREGLGPGLPELAILGDDTLCATDQDGGDDQRIRQTERSFRPDDRGDARDLEVDPHDHQAVRAAKASPGTPPALPNRPRWSSRRTPRLR